MRFLFGFGPPPPPAAVPFKSFSSFGFLFVALAVLVTLVSDFGETVVVLSATGLAAVAWGFGFGASLFDDSSTFCVGVDLLGEEAGAGAVAGAGTGTGTGAGVASVSLDPLFTGDFFSSGLLCGGVLTTEM